MEQYYNANLLVNILLLIYLITSIKSMNLFDLFIVIFFIIFSIVLLPDVDLEVLLNINLFLISCFLIFRVNLKKKKLKQKFIITNKKTTTYILLLFMVAFIFTFKGVRGWQSVITTTFVYYIISISIWLYYAETTKAKNVNISVIYFYFFILILGLILFSKVILATVSIIIYAYIYQNRKQLKNYQSLLTISSVVFIAVIFIFYNREAINLFIDERVLRSDYTKDTKLLGLSDGGRFIVWQAFLDGAVIWGAGSVDLVTNIPTHNIFIHLVHELGVIPGGVFSLFFICILIMYIKRGFYLYPLLLLLICVISSFFEYSSIWVPFVWFIPLFIYESELKNDI